MENRQWAKSLDLAAYMVANQAPTVEVLINEDKRTWNEEVVDGLFVPEEAELIKKIHLSRHPTEDKLFWLWTQSGQYSCKSGYRFLKHKDEEEGSVATQVKDKKFWRSIWDLRVPNKIKNLLWRACRDSIPTKENLRRQHITDNSLCERSLSDEESPLQALWSCSELNSVWSSLEWNFHQNTSVTNFKELLSWILKNQGNPELFAMIT